MGEQSENYYREKLNASKLFAVYETNIPRVKQYLAAEIDHVKNLLTGTETVLELGAGYGRIVKELAPHCQHIVGIDISEANVELARAYLQGISNADIEVMDAHHLACKRQFDLVLCLQNGLSAMRMDGAALARLMAVVKPGGKAVFSSYSANFWEVRLAWFYEQADKGLLGPIDAEKTRDGAIVCEDGFRATTQSVADFQAIGERLGYPYKTEEVDRSSLFFIIDKPV
ncbi:MAG TPA: class I SAM-dependent methyltransferase [Oscillospiraceae bacterium]|nr:class I SAM-dependent methyltransferase [Oscillospiraceae bacterium]